jgi:hypothetical protein
MAFSKIGRSFVGMATWDERETAAKQKDVSREL